MAYWGWALVLGPNLNLMMQDEVRDQAWEAMQTAVSLKGRVSEKERAMIEGDHGPDELPSMVSIVSIPALWYK